MDTTTTVATTAVKSPEPDTQNPTRAQPQPFTNGVLKRRAPLHLHHHHGHPIVVTYKECLKNHAASMGGHAVDGCGEFMPSPSLNPSDPTSLKCAACGCHRNFHRRDPEVTAAQPPPPALEYQPHHRHLPPPPRVSPSNQNSPSDSPSPPPISSTYPHHMLLSLSNQQGTHHHSAAAAAAAAPHLPSSALSNSNTRKRFRTKFTQDQKQKMLKFAERVAWRMQKRDEDIINQFCNEIGVEKGVFKVWMHNNKNTSSAKKDQQILSNTTGNNNGDHDNSHGNNGVDSYGGDEMRHQMHLQNLSHHQQQQIATHGHEDNSTGTSGNNGHGVATNASNSSSS